MTILRELRETSRGANYRETHVYNEKTTESHNNNEKLNMKSYYKGRVQ